MKIVAFRKSVWMLGPSFLTRSQGRKVFIHRVDFEKGCVEMTLFNFLLSHLNYLGCRKQKQGGQTSKMWSSILMLATSFRLLSPFTGASLFVPLLLFLLAAVFFPVETQGGVGLPECLLRRRNPSTDCTGADWWALWLWTSDCAFCKLCVYLKLWKNKTKQNLWDKLDLRKEISGSVTSLSPQCLVPAAGVPSGSPRLFCGLRKEPPRPFLAPLHAAFP